MNRFTPNGLLGCFQRLLTAKLTKRQLIALLIGLPVSTYHLIMGLSVALNVPVSSTHWAQFRTLGLCERSDETLKTLIYHVGCGLIVSVQAFAGYFASHWQESLIMLLTATVVYVDLSDLRRKRRRQRRKRR